MKLHEGVQWHDGKPFTAEDVKSALQKDDARPVISHQRQGTCWWPYVKSIHLSTNSIYDQ